MHGRLGVFSRFGDMGGEVLSIEIGGSRRGCRRGIGVLAGLEVKRRVACGGIDSVVVRELGESEPFRPIILIAVAIDAQESFDFLVHLFGLAVGLRMVGRGRIVFDTEKAKEFLRRLGHEASVAVRDDFLGGAGVAEDVVAEESS